jgi:DNA-binding transcriptional LysR family regulator
LQRNKERRVVRINPAFVLNDFVAVLELAKRGHGVALVPEIIAASDLAQGTLVRVLKDWSSVPKPLQLVWPAQREMSAAVKALIEHLTRAFQARI